MRELYTIDLWGDLIKKKKRDGEIFVRSLIDPERLVVVADFFIILLLFLSKLAKDLGRFDRSSTMTGVCRMTSWGRPNSTSRSSI